MFKVISKQIIAVYHDDIYEEYPDARIAVRELGLLATRVNNILKVRDKTTDGSYFKCADKFEEDFFSLFLLERK